MHNNREWHRNMYLGWIFFFHLCLWKNMGWIHFRNLKKFNILKFNNNEICSTFPIDSLVFYVWDLFLRKTEKKNKLFCCPFYIIKHFVHPHDLCLMYGAHLIFFEKVPICKFNRVLLIQYRGENLVVVPRRKKILKKNKICSMIIRYQWNYFSTCNLIS